MTACPSTAKTAHLVDGAAVLIDQLYKRRTNDIHGFRSLISARPASARQLHIHRAVD